MNIPCTGKRKHREEEKEEDKDELAFKLAWQLEAASLEAAPLSDTVDLDSEECPARTHLLSRTINVYITTMAELYYKQHLLGLAPNPTF